MYEIGLPSQVSDTNKINLGRLVNLVSYKVSDTPASETSSPSKQLIIDTINEAQRMFAVRLDSWNWLNKTVPIKGYDYNSVAVSNINFFESAINSTLSTYNQTGGNNFYIAQKFTYGDSNSLIKSVSVEFNKPSGVQTASFQAYFVGDLSGNPNMLDIKCNSTAVIMSDIPTSSTIKWDFEEQFIPLLNTNYWIVIKCIGSAFDITAKGYASVLKPIIDQTYMITNDLNSGWNPITGFYVALWLGYELTPKNYLYMLEGPSDMQTAQRMFVPPTNVPSVYVLKQLPYDTYQNSVFGNYMLGTEFFAVSGFTTSGRPKIIIPMNLRRDLWMFDYKAKVTTLVDDDNIPQLPSEYSYLLVKQAVYELSMLGYGSQDAVFIAGILKDVADGIKYMIRDYNNSNGEQHINIIGGVHFPSQQSRVKQLNSKYAGPHRLGITPPTGY